jgi:hypothetical protein
MTQLEIALAARAFRDGRAKRIARYRHRRLVDKPLAVVLWQLGAEPFSAAAIGFGCRDRDLQFVVAGDPRNRDLAFAALRTFAEWFNPRFEAPAADREPVQRGEYAFTRACSAPQVLVANGASVEMIGRLGRRLAYLRTDGAQPAPPELVRLGQHLLFLARHARVPGQQLVIALTDLLASHWATSQSPMERLSLAALNAFISPPKGIHGFHAAATEEHQAVGPVPAGEDDERLDPLVSEFNQHRGKSTDPSVVKRLLPPIETHYKPLVQRTWDLLWECRGREMSWPEAASVSRRWDLDREAYTQHIDWTARDGRRRTRQTVRQAAILLSRLEDATAMVEAEEACDDPLRMIPFLLDNKAVQGRVVRVDRDHRETVNVRRMRRPLVTIASPDLCLMPRGKELWWTASADGCSYEVHEVRPAGEGSEVTLKLNTSSLVALPRVGDEACFSIHSTTSFWRTNLPPAEPWTHRPTVPAETPAPIEDTQV